VNVEKRKLNLNLKSSGEKRNEVIEEIIPKDITK
jgi:hypothetical protein